MAPNQHNVLNFPPEPDSKLFPEPQPLKYSTSSSTPLVLDFGSFTTRAGWAGQRDPCLSFRSLAGKAKSGKGDIVNVAGDQLLCKDIIKTVMRSPFEKDVLQNLESAETLLDYTFMQLGINTERVQHPVMITEGVCAPNYARGRMYEMLFECYGVPKVAFGIDALLAYEYNAFSADLAASMPLTANWQGSAASGLIVRVGHACSHVIPVVDGRAALEAAYRLNAGGQRITDTLNDLLRLRFPQHRQAITASRVSFVKEHLCSVALDYSSALSAMAQELEEQDLDGTCSFVRRLQLPFTEKDVPTQTSEDMERRTKLREEQTRRLIEMARTKRVDKLNALTSQLNALLDLQVPPQGQGSRVRGLGFRVPAVRLARLAGPAP
jgi:actin-related protein 5